MASVRVDAPDLCPRFTARIITGVTIGPSPWWLRKRLETLGQRPVNNVVDATNYVMFECGQPLHAYDLDALHGRSIIVRRGVAGEKLAAINNKEYAITPEMLVIADADRAVGLAGVMGGLDTEIGPTSRDVLLESARFDAMAVRKASRALNLPSEAGRRFERPLDPAMTEWASRRCAAADRRDRRRDRPSRAHRRRAARGRAAPGRAATGPDPPHPGDRGRRG